MTHIQSQEPFLLKGMLKEMLFFCCCFKYAECFAFFFKFKSWMQSLKVCWSSLSTEGTVGGAV